MTEISVSGAIFNVLVEGNENKAVVMLAHPLGTNLHLWDPQIPALLEHFRVVRYDSRGHGASVASQGPYSIEGLGRDALAIMDALAIEKVHWLGLSMGSVVGLWLLTHAQERIGRAVLANTAAQIAGPDLWNSRIQSAREAGMDGITTILAERWFTKTFRDTHPEKVETVMALVRTTPLHGYLAACAALRDMDQRDAIRSITNKVLVIAGRHDPSTPPGMGALVANSIEGAKFVTLEASHISNIEDEANFTKLVVDFLTAPETAGVTPTPRPKARAKKAPAKKVAAKKTAPKKTVAKQAPNKKAAAKKSSREQASAKKVPVKKTPHKKRKTKEPAKKTAAKKTTRGTGSKRRPPKKTGASKKTSGRKKAEE
jgi:3-oxoadipate enol-lactonase